MLNHPLVRRHNCCASNLRATQRHVIETEPVRCEGADWSRLSVIPLTAAALAVGIPLADLHLHGKVENCGRHHIGGARMALVRSQW
jgi:hypothetical protein